jgi:hypothetical protein
LKYGKISKIPNKIFSNAKNLHEVDLTENYCISEEFKNANESLSYVEDILYPCSCKLKESDDLGSRLKKTLNFLGVLAIVLLGVFVVWLKKEKEKRKPPESATSNFPLQKGIPIKKKTLAPK